MVRREIEIDEETDRLLAELAAEYQGNLGKAVADLVLAHEGLENFVEQSEGLLGDSMMRQIRDRAEADFHEGRTVGWACFQSNNL